MFMCETEFMNNGWERTVAYKYLSILFVLDRARRSRRRRKFDRAARSRSCTLKIFGLVLMHELGRRNLAEVREDHIRAQHLLV